jgi:glycosyltransferase involved in cell wall biosynthesis
MDKKVAVIVPSYNSLKYLEDLFESLKTTNDSRTPSELFFKYI